MTAVSATILLVAISLDLIIGDPRYPLHPVRLIGHLIHLLEKILRRLGLDSYIGGGLLLILSTVIPVSTWSSLYFLFSDINWLPELWTIFLVYSCLGMGDLIRHARPIAKALERHDLPLARERVSWIVGRDVSQLYESGIARAAIESVAENFVDAFLAPVFWFGCGAILFAHTGGDPLLGGGLAILVHRVANTLDAMVGYRNERYRKLGCASARCDDLLNFIPARLSIPLISLAALISGNDARKAIRTGCRDRKNHPSPNSAHGESTVAGALDIALGGPTPYPYGTVDKPWLNAEGHPAEATDISKTMRLTTVSAIISGILIAGILWIT
ncbi:adenosylcobinamide-phosphate synthase CbiB [Puniceicoccus vermicola]|uniref:Cobalamin biosynthesis protein CobD n=1 Tax=Puniceicoccus vermicola TaxID=388746 RepID=A0A7X1E6P9_9BACT|nr:adenosylcobinamide-phosphate synthase CbiB [Puniceicoccus vermicola]MBC2602887.1 cobalamin biosynthesis protein CobD [Puniceicoccus vermicola]